MRYLIPASILLILTTAFVMATPVPQIGDTINETCPFTGKALRDSSPSVDYGKDTVGFCCGGCKGRWAKLSDEEQHEKLVALGALGEKPKAAPPSKSKLAPSSIEKVPTIHTIYLLDACPISGRPVSKESPTKVYDGRQVRFCCNGCSGRFGKDLDAGWEKIADMVIEQQLENYPLDTCVVGGGELGSMGEPINHVYGNRLVRFCCAHCVGGFEKDPAKYLDRINTALIEQQSADYPLTTCAVGGGALNANPVNIVVGNTLVKLCCGGCQKKVLADPLTYVAMVKDAATNR